MASIMEKSGENDPRLLYCPSDDKAFYELDPAGLRDPKRALVFEPVGTHHRLSRRLPRGHHACFLRHGVTEVKFIEDPEGTKR